MTAERGASRSLVLLFALTSGAAVANIYYVQPLLPVLSHALGVSAGTAGLLVTASQLGYVGGLAFLVPLGDMLQRRRLLVILSLSEAAALGACALAPGILALAGVLAVAGSLSVVAVLVIPLAASLATPSQRGQAVGTVMSGLLLGVLAARTASGVLAQAGGWRLVFGFAATLMLALATLLWRNLPATSSPVKVPMRALLRSTLRLVADQPVPRERMVLGALQMAGFSVLWTSISFLLAGPAYRLSEGAIGLFRARRGHRCRARSTRRPMGRSWPRPGGPPCAFLATILLSWVVLALGRSSLIALTAGVILLDLGVQGANVANQAAILPLAPDARSRLTTAYVTAIFVGGTAGSLIAAPLVDTSWTITCLLGGALAIAALALRTFLARRTSKKTTADAISPDSGHLLTLATPDPAVP